MRAKSQYGNGVRFMGDTVSHFPNSLRQNGFGQASKTTDVVHVFGADLAQVLANWEQQGMMRLLGTTVAGHQKFKPNQK